MARLRRSAMSSMKARTSTIHSELASVASSLLRDVAAHLLRYREPANPRGMLRSRRPGETGNLRTPRPPLRRRMLTGNRVQPSGVGEWN
jgi:hypothetical protein